MSIVNLSMYMCNRHCDGLSKMSCPIKHPPKRPPQTVLSDFGEYRRYQSPQMAITSEKQAGAPVRSLLANAMPLT